MTRGAPALISLFSHLNVSPHCCPAGGRHRSRVKPLTSGNHFQKPLFLGGGGGVTKQMYMRRTRIYWSLPGPARPFSHRYAISAVNRGSVLCFVQKKRRSVLSHAVANTDMFRGRRLVCTLVCAFLARGVNALTVPPSSRANDVVHKVRRLQSTRGKLATGCRVTSFSAPATSAASLLSGDTHFSTKRALHQTR